eukprot:CAMPEP_0183292812 /NCGR_PEP_ID=MMETSP0160_2-20130417/1729_1 /TAXON_ID=2839 ORGANISM="Odontella Sinensis, Strain Grunow 1884" /NCGR_SAMPLE_ID=MMETSP0160_2 /ASSEMBLY_ACC=CAM_ASM_000250 /LENGTH=83 /DNA_ID=CAMNT_0025453825 /DNA_START=263 /DNA_END=514 /DNA_ORIENTATION=-
MATTSAKEIKATKEWTLIGENDTLPAGLHIRINLSTGEKWAKIPDNDDDDGSKEPIVVEVGPSTKAAIEVTSNGTFSVLDKDI